MTTYVELRDKVSRTLQDPDNTVFEDAIVKDMVAAAFAEVSRVAPWRFTDDIACVEDQLNYQPLADAFPDPNDDIDILSVELWSGDTPPRPLRQIEPLSAHPMGLTYSDAGWSFWGGYLTIPTRVADMIGSHTEYVLRIRGYAPWPLLVDDADVVPFSSSIEEAVVLVCQIEALRRLINNRALFTQWQTRSNNTDVTPAALMNDLNIAQEEWRRKARAITVLREQP
jgi:hypothetical protein